MITIDAKTLMSNEKFHSVNIDTEEFKTIIEDIISEMYPGDEMVSFDIGESGTVDIKLESGEEVEIEVDWNEIILK